MLGGSETADRGPKGRVTIAKTIWEVLTFNHNENKFLNCIVTGDEMWIHYAEPET